MLYRILRDLGCLNRTRRQAAIRMARGLPWEDLDQFLAFYDRGRAEARRGAFTIFFILFVVLEGIVSLFYLELSKRGILAVSYSLATLAPFPVLLAASRSRHRADLGLKSILQEIDESAFVAVALGILSETHADAFSFRPDLLRAIARLLPEVTLEQCQDWTPEERNALTRGLHTVLPVSAGGRDALSHSHVDFALIILKVLQRIGDGREVDLVRLVGTIDPITDQHQKVREASLKCLRSIEKRMSSASEGPAHLVRDIVPVQEPRPVSRMETNLSHLLKPRKQPRAGA